jgi:hypothetical protein
VSRRSGTIALVAAVVGGAVVQGALAAPGLGRIPDALFVLLVGVSVVALVAQLVLAARGALAVAEGRRGRGAAALGVLAAWAAIVVLAAAVAGVLLPPALPFVLVVALCVLPAAARGRGNALAGFRAFRDRPWSAVLATLVSLLAVAGCAVGALLSGFFLTGALGGAVMWLGFGAVGAALLLWWTRLTAPRA